MLLKIAHVEYACPLYAYLMPMPHGHAALITIQIEPISLHSYTWSVSGLLTIHTPQDQPSARFRVRSLSLSPVDPSSGLSGLSADETVSPLVLHILLAEAHRGELHRELLHV